MAQQKITEKQVAQQLLESAHVLVTQMVEQGNGTSVESLRRIPLSVFFAEIYDARNDNPDVGTGEVTTYDTLGDFLRALSRRGSIAPDDLGLEQDPDTGYVYLTYRGERFGNGIPLAASGNIAIASDAEVAAALDDIFGTE